ncbi:MAG: N-acetyltransferase [Thermoprotei archaeon]|nr:MAG: N-acetyltransferase [Thermoprotei archaeon]
MYVSKRAIVRGRISTNSIILGPTKIGSNTLVDSYVIIGYPTQRKLIEINRKQKDVELLKIMDSLSEGAIIGSDCIVRSSTVIYEGAVLEDHVRVGHNVLIREGSVVKKGCIIGTQTILDGPVYIGENTSIQSAVYIPAKVRIGRNVFIGPRVVFTNDIYPPSRRLVETVVEDNAVIGANATIVAGIVIGKNSVVAAGAVVTKSVPPDTVVAGVPAKVISSRKEYDEKKQRYELSSMFPVK